MAVRVNSITFAPLNTNYDMKNIFLAGLFLFGSAAVLSAQKYGHLNFGNLIAQMPETKSADSDLEAFQRQLVAKGEDMATAFQEKYSQFMSDVQNGVLSPVQQQERQQELQQEQQEIMGYEQEIRQQVQTKQQELLEPIITKAEEAIQAVAQENGYVMVFDTSNFNAVLFAQDSDDLMSLVMAKLGLE